MLYLDNAATTFPKPRSVLDAMEKYFSEIGANCGRAAYPLAQEASRMVFETRELVASLIGAPDSSRVVFTSGATEALNLALLGLLREGDRVVTTSMEHNSVMRPLSYLRATRGVEVVRVACSPRGELDPDDVRRALFRGAKMLVSTAASNVCGTLMPLRELGLIAREHDCLFLVDGAQAVGVIPINVTELGIDLLAFSGHKGLLGPQGTGCLYVAPGAEPEPLKFGGTGSRSEEEKQPDFLPDRYESGTLNLVGLAGLGEGVRFIQEKGIAALSQYERKLTAQLLQGLQEIPGARIYGPRDPEKQVSVVSFNLANLSCSQAGELLARDHQVAVRTGLHCSPSAHRTLGTYPHGTVRVSLGPFNTEEDIAFFLHAVEEISPCAVS